MGICADRKQKPRQQIKTQAPPQDKKITQKSEKAEEIIHPNSNTANITSNLQQAKTLKQLVMANLENTNLVIKQENKENDIDEIFDFFEKNPDSELITYKKDKIEAKNEKPKEKEKEKEQIDQKNPPLVSLKFVKSQLLMSKQAKKEQIQEDDVQQKRQQRKQERQEDGKETQKKSKKEKGEKDQNIKNVITYRPNMKKIDLNHKQFEEWRPPF